MSTVNRAYQKGFIRPYIRLQRILLTPHWRGLIYYVFPCLLCLGLLALILAHGDNFKILQAKVETAFHKLVSHPDLQVNGLRIIASTEELHAKLAVLVNQKFPVNSLVIDLEMLREKAEAIPAIEKATVEIEPGGFLTITAIEREPSVILRRGKDLFLLDENGLVLLQAENRLDHMALPLITGDSAEKFVPEALEIFAAAAGVRDSIRGLVRVGMRRWDLVFDGNRRVLLPAERPAEAVQRLMILEIAELLLQRKLVSVDLRDPSRTSVRLPQS